MRQALARSQRPTSTDPSGSIRTHMVIVAGGDFFDETSLCHNAEMMLKSPGRRTTTHRKTISKKRNTRCENPFLMPNGIERTYINLVLVSFFGHFQRNGLQHLLSKDFPTCIQKAPESRLLRRVHPAVASSSAVHQQPIPKIGPKHESRSI